ncbi:hypothetical protein BH09BAC5_BH09BAC5_15780 [soil metagenome]
MQINPDGSRITKAEKDSIVTNSNLKWKYEDEFYTVYHLNNQKIELRDHRPSQKDTMISVCIPAAFTQLDDGSIDGLFIIDGKITDAKKVNHHLGGGLLITADKVQMIKTDEGKLLTQNWMDSVCKLNASFFQQIQLVREGKALEFNKDQKLFQRRAIVQYEDSSIAMIESKWPLTLQDFTNDLMKMKVWNAIYTDMGSYDEGWVRNPDNGKLIVIGKNRMETAQQSNWVVFVK